ncbi:hypothetical protein AB0451_39530 [Streptomyces sp. NPDC052000]|uniref:hypothetical protein n=1 Tax=Streptomyces sp. NPDC052000 TaxID=3155676 RepID=UPI00344F98D5
MDQNPSQDARTERLLLMVTPAEKSAVKAYARQMGTSMSTGGRHLLLQGLKATKINEGD